MMAFLQRFNPEWQKRYDQFNDTPAGNSFRATMMVAAISHAFQKDLRADFRAINYPISDSDWAFLNPQLLSVSATALAFNTTPAGPASVSVTASDNWSATSSQPWLTADVSTGSGNQVVSLSAAVNPSLALRTATFTVSANGLIDQVVTITQAGTLATLTVSTTTLTVDAAGSGTASVSVTSNTSWTAVSTQSWLTLSPAVGTGDAVITLTVPANGVPQTRTAIVTVSTAGLHSRTLTVMQSGSIITAVNEPLFNELVLFPSPVVNQLQVRGLPVGCELTLYDGQGRLIEQGRVKRASSFIDTGSLAAGLYYLKVTHIDGITVRRFIKVD